MRLLPNDRTVHDFIFKQQDKGATLRGACMKLGMTISDARHSFCRLGKSGEISTTDISSHLKWMRFWRSTLLPATLA